MKILNRLVIGIITMLSVAAGLAKAMQAPQEMEFLTGLGLTGTQVVVFGVVQIAAGVMLLSARSRLIGAGLATVAFLASSILIFIDGNLVFGSVSLLPAAG